jgi:hypothetical protein
MRTNTYHVLLHFPRIGLAIPPRRKVLLLCLERNLACLLRQGKKALRLSTFKPVRARLPCVALFLVGFSALGMLETPDRTAFSSLQYSKASFRRGDLISLNNGFSVALDFIDDYPISLVESSPILCFVNQLCPQLIGSLRFPVDVWKKAKTYKDDVSSTQSDFCR